jgi:protein N-terminal methyltransferase
MRALDCGAGIGRVSKTLLMPLFGKVDLLESNSKFLEKAAEQLSNEPAFGESFCQTLQSFIMPQQCYDIIWIQWVLGYLTDGDLVVFLQRARGALKSSLGIIYVKENILKEDHNDTIAEVDTDDCSVIR